MTHKIKIAGTEVNYELALSDRARHLRLTMHSGRGLVATLPRRSSLRELERFMVQKSSWILRMLERGKKFIAPQLPRQNRRDYLARKEAARRLVRGRASQLNQNYGFSYNRIAIRNTKSRWGSCSKKGNLNFNYRIVYLKPEVADYLIVHELCHLKEFNHSRRFWELVARTVPAYKALRRELRGDFIGPPFWGTL